MIDCTNCKFPREESEFYRNKTKVNGRETECKYCNKARALKWQIENPEKASKRTGEWAKRNPEKRRQYLSKYRALKRGNGHEPYDREQIIREEGSICHICKKPAVDLELDHVIPISKGGADVRSNIKVACGKCNRKKSDKIDYAI